jgi:HPt (histidine-containing phosphotransfer) domain-containing protein
MSTDIIIDPVAIENLRALNPDDGDAFLKDIVGIFLEDTPQRIDELKKSLAAKDQPTFTRAAHSIKGSSSNLGAQKLRLVSEQLEHKSKQDGLANLESLVAQLEAEYGVVKDTLEKLVGIQ